MVDKVPTVVRMGVLTMFPLIESLGELKGSNYEKLCSSILNMLQNVLAELKPLALFDEPSDCINTFYDWVITMIQNRFQHKIDSSLALQSVHTLIALTISRASATQMLNSINKLLCIQKENGNNFKLHIDLSPFLSQLFSHRKQQFNSLSQFALKGNLFFF